jgi:mutator protein MutT
MSLFTAVVECIIEHDKKILIIRRPKGVHAENLLAFPGGKVEYKDGIEGSSILIEAIKREVFEEVGITLMDPLYFITSSYFETAKKEPILSMVFHCKLKSSKPHVTPSPTEVPEWYWMTRKDLLEKEETPPWVKKALQLC